MNTKLLLIVSAAILTVSVGSVNAKPVQLTSTQLDKVAAGGADISQSSSTAIIIVNGKIVHFERQGDGNVHIESPDGQLVIYQSFNLDI